MEYPNKIKKSYTKITNYSNRGMDLESIIEEANVYYREENIAYIYKKPTPIGVVNVKYKNGSKRITDAYYKTPSTLDFNGLYKGYYIEFDAKATTNTTSLPLANIHPHQINHIKKIHEHKGIVFLIISINNEYYCLNSFDFLNFLATEKRKSIPYTYIKDKAYKIEYNYSKGLDYIPAIDKWIGGLYEKN